MHVDASLVLTSIFIAADVLGDNLKECDQYLTSPPDVEHNLLEQQGVETILCEAQTQICGKS